MAEGVFAIQWRQIPQAQIPFSTTSDSLTGNNLANGVILNNVQIPRYRQLEFADISFLTGSGGNARLQICFGAAQVGRKVKLYFSFGSTWYEYEVQVWGAGCWTIRNLGGGGGSSPNALIFGNPVDIFSDFNLEEANPGFPPPTYNPFIPRLIISLEQDFGLCMASEKIKIIINEIPTVELVSANVYKDGGPTPIADITQLIAGVLFTDPGDYQIRISYIYKGGGDDNPPVANPPIEQFTRDFHIFKLPFPHIQKQSRTYGFLIPGENVRFNEALEDDGTVEYDIQSSEFTLSFCGVYFIKWFIAPQSGYTIDGANLAIAVGGAPGFVGSSHTKVSAVTGFSIVKVNGPPLTVSLVNVSDNIIIFSQGAQVKAGIVIFRIDEGTPLGGENSVPAESEEIMAISYLELQKKNEPANALAVVNPGDHIKFDADYAIEGLYIAYDPVTGIITFNEEGYYYFDWYVAPQYGLTTDGSNWAVQISDRLSRIGSSHIKVSPTIGFAIIHIDAGETARLVNVSDSALTLSQAVQSQAALTVYSVTAMNFAP